jgi:hypothetical protein
VHRPVGHLAVLAGAAGDDHDVRAGDVGQRGARGQVQAGSVVDDEAGTFGDEAHLGAGQAAQHLVGADRVEHGEPVIEQDGDLHDSP